MGFSGLSTIKLPGSRVSLLALVLFVVSLMFQPILSAKVTRIDDQGRSVLVCTLQGLTVLSIDANSVDDHSITSNDCPVCALNSMLTSTALNSDVSWQFGSPRYGYAVIASDIGYTESALLLPPLRAPPLFTLS